MRFYFCLSRTTRPISYKCLIDVGSVIEDWFKIEASNNDIPDYSVSWLHGYVSTPKGYIFPNGSGFFLSSPHDKITYHVSRHLAEFQHYYNPRQFFFSELMRLEKFTEERFPRFGCHHRFIPRSPVLLERKEEGEDYYRTYCHTDPESAEIMTALLQQKLKTYQLPTDVEVRFDTTSKSARVVEVYLKNETLSCSWCPIIIKGHPDALSFAWDVGIGDRAKHGFGAIK